MQSPLVVRCPYCGSRSRARSDWAGKHVRCPGCGQAIAVPSHAPIEVVPVVLANDEPTTPVPRPRPLGLRSATQRRSKQPVIIILLVVGASLGGLMLLGCAGLVALLRNPRATAARLNAHVESAVESSIADVPGRPDWVADAELVAQLGPDVKFGGHAIRLPPGYSSLGGAPDDSGLSPPETRTADQMWLSQMMPGLGFAAIRAELRQVPATTDGPEHFERRLPDELKELRNSYGNRNLRAQAGRLGGKRAVRVTYTATTRQDSHDCVKIFRFEGNRQLVLTLLCPSGADRRLYWLLEAAILSVREIDDAASQ